MWDEKEEGRKKREREKAERKKEEPKGIEEGTEAIHVSFFFIKKITLVR